jgi:predicted aconitase
MLNGEMGELLAEVFSYIVKFGEAFDAEKMVDIVYAHHPAEMAIYRGEVESIIELADKGANVCVPTTSSTLCMDLDQWRKTGVPAELAHKQLEVIEPHKRMGIIGTYTCTPYLLGYLPPKASYTATVESSAIIYYNSVLGVKTNRGGIFTKFSAITGKYPYMGYLIDENRKGTHLINVDFSKDNLKTALDYNLLGFYVGEIVGSEVPVFNGLSKIPGTYLQENLIGLGAALATSGSISLYHIPGVTPEARSVNEAFQDDKFNEQFDVGKAELNSVRQKLTTGDEGKIDFVTLGCPHYNLDRIRQVANMLDGKKIHSDVRLWICTNRMTKRAAEWNGYVEIIENAGGLVICDSCPVESHMRASTCVEYGLPTPQINTMVTESAKMARYVKDLIGCDTILADLKGCIGTAISGKWEGY